MLNEREKQALLARVPATRIHIDDIASEVAAKLRSWGFQPTKVVDDVETDQCEGVGEIHFGDAVHVNVDDQCGPSVSSWAEPGKPWDGAEEKYWSIDHDRLTYLQLVEDLLKFGVEPGGVHPVAVQVAV